MKILDPITLFFIIWWFVCIVIFMLYRVNKIEKELNEYIDKKLQEYIDELKNSIKL